MFLVVCATEFELQALAAQSDPLLKNWISLVTGVGPVETVLALTRFFESRSAASRDEIHGVLNCGVAGAYVRDGAAKADLLEICLAEEELFGDLGISYPDRIEALDENLLPRQRFSLDPDLLDRAESLLVQQGIPVQRGVFVTVSGVTATEQRGSMLERQHAGLCENMEGAAVARVCMEYHVPLLELRAISNYVEERDPGRWKLPEACERAGTAAAVFLQAMSI